MDKKFIPKITVFHCINAFADNTPLPFVGGNDVEIKFIKLPCSSMVKDVFLLRAFEAGADGVVALVCPEGQCRYVEGNIRAKKRVAWVKNLLDDIGIDGRRLSLSNIAAGDTAAATQIIEDTLKNLAELGHNPAA
ncbi:MAG: hydrogenase iron-sulfur subunit [Deltaproteobacteria bacterium]|nr:hydrogenase iron-sulfur subunit [Deltaproteobacteria bacterium]MBW2013346.1 hydrogenase iron-sulfur subunit [Deltaproteobacteria bacterium]